MVQALRCAISWRVRRSQTRTSPPSPPLTIWRPLCVTATVETPPLNGTRGEGSKGERDQSTCRHAAHACAVRLKCAPARHADRWASGNTHSTEPLDASIKRSSPPA